MNSQQFASLLKAYEKMKANEENPNKRAKIEREIEDLKINRFFEWLKIV